MTDMNLRFRYSNRFVGNGIEAIRWPRNVMPPAPGAMDAISRAIRGRTPSLQIHHVARGGKLIMASYDGIGAYDRSVTVNPGEWIVYVDGRWGFGDDAYLELLLQQRSEAARVRRIRAATPLCSATTLDPLGTVSMCTLPAGHSGLWHQRKGDGEKSVAWRSEPAVAELLLGQAARIMNEMSLGGVLDDSAYGSEIAAWLRLWTASGIADPSPIVDPLQNAASDTIESLTGNETQEETQCDEGND